MGIYRRYLPDKKEREEIKADVTSRVLYDVFLNIKEDDSYIRTLLNETVSAEINRWKKGDNPALASGYLKFLKPLKKKLHGLSDTERRFILKKIAEMYLDEIQGNFSEFIYSIATVVVPRGMSFLLASITPSSLISYFPYLPNIDNYIILAGNTTKVINLAKKGTVILVPTHVSHLDSPLIGYIVYKLGLPPFLYGAGLNLFANPILGFFMRNLGAYKVDRIRKHQFYLNTLKNYVCATLERGYDHIFFPEGTRSRSGEIAQKLKMGLLGCGIKSFINNLQSGNPRPNIYIVPATITYQVTLEAESLIKQYLEDATKEDWISYSDEAFMIGRVFKFIKRFVSLDMKCIVRITDAFDPFGNHVDDEGNSLDPHGRVIEPSRYVIKDGKPEHDPQRDEEFTKELMKKVIETYRKNNTVLSTNLSALTIFEMALKKVGESDEIRALELIDGLELDLHSVLKNLDIARNKFTELFREGKIYIHDKVLQKTPRSILDTASKVFSKFHTTPPFRTVGRKAVIVNPPLLLYYRNRLKGYIKID